MKIALVVSTTLVTGCLVGSTFSHSPGLVPKDDPLATADQREQALQDLLANPVGPAFLQSVAPELLEELSIAGETAGGCAVFAPGTPDWYISNTLQRLGYLFEDSTRYQLSFSRWGSGQSVTLYYSFPPDGIGLSGWPDQENTNFMHERWSDPAAFGSEAAWKTFFAQAFDSWSMITGNTYIEVSDDGASWPGSPGPFNDSGQDPNIPSSILRGDIRIVSAINDGQGNVLAFNFFPSNGGDMLLDSADLTSNFYLSPNNNFRFLRNVIIHEHGHGLGIRHECPANGHAIMQPFITTAFDGPQLDDRLAGYAKNSDRFDPNDSIAAATDLDAEGYTHGTTFTVNQVALANNDSDYYSFTVPKPSKLDVAVIPKGSTYNSGVQLSGGACSTGTPFSAQQQADLRFIVYDTNQLVLLSVDDRTTGLVEFRTDVNLPTSGTYTVRVLSSSWSGPQEYDLILTSTTGQLLGDISGDGAVNGVDLSILLSQWGPVVQDGDLNNDGFVDGADLGILLGDWTG